MPKEDVFQRHEVGSIYATARDRFVVSLVVGFGAWPRAAKTPLEALRDALVFADCKETVWFVYDRETGSLYALARKDAAEEVDVATGGTNGLAVK
jgi:hypothetical protein